MAGTTRRERIGGFLRRAERSPLSALALIGLLVTASLTAREPDITWYRWIVPADLIAFWGDPAPLPEDPVEVGSCAVAFSGYAANGGFEAEVRRVGSARHADVHWAGSPRLAWGPWAPVVEFGGEYLVVSSGLAGELSEGEVIDAYFRAILVGAYDEMAPDVVEETVDDWTKTYWSDAPAKPRVYWGGVAHSVVALILLIGLGFNLRFVPTWIRIVWWHAFGPEPGHCPKCGYDMRGLGERKCPECGVG
jgi:hypothetical protein